jgi:hypothetical protein
MSLVSWWDWIHKSHWIVQTILAMLILFQPMKMGRLSTFFVFFNFFYQCFIIFIEKVFTSLVKFTPRLIFELYWVWLLYALLFSQQVVAGV